MLFMDDSLHAFPVRVLPRSPGGIGHEGIHQDALIEHVKPSLLFDGVPPLLWLNRERVFTGLLIERPFAAPARTACLAVFGVIGRQGPLPHAEAGFHRFQKAPDSPVRATRDSR